MVSRRLLRDRILAVVVLFVVLVYYLAPILFQFIPMLSIAWFDGIRGGVSVFMIGLLVFYLIEGQVHQSSVLANRVSIAALVEGFRDANPEPFKQEATQIRIATSDAPLGLHYSIYLLVLSDLLTYGYFLGSYALSMVITIVSILMIMAALVNALALFVAQKQTEVSVFYDQIMIHIPDVSAFVVRKADLTKIRLDYPKKTFWKASAPRPTCEFVTSAPLVAIEMSPQLALALRDYGYGVFVE